MSEMVRTRFAPSPTGPLHIGSARTALFTWLLARHHGGKFVLRIEDTDQTRFVEGSTEVIQNGLRWLGLDWDEGPDIGGPYGPYIQSERLDLYREWAQWLVDHDKAYYAYETPEELTAIAAEQEAKNLPRGYDGRARLMTRTQEQDYIDEGRAPVIRFKAPQEGTTVVHDAVRGEVEFENNTIQDMILLKSDGYPTYHLAVIVDDHLMNITHVTRSIEWFPSLPLHYHLWQAFNWEMPQYVHVPLILNPNGKGKLSKRHAGQTSDGRAVPILVSEFIDLGYYAPAVVNFLTNTGYNFGDEREIFDVEETIERFDLSRISPANSIFPVEKLEWLNGVYIREKLSVDELAHHLRGALEQAGLTVDADLLKRVAPLVQVRIKTFNDVVDVAGFFFRDEFIPPQPDALVQRKMDAESTGEMLRKSYDLLKAQDDWNHESTHQLMADFAAANGLKNGQVFGALRVAVTGQRVSPPTFETMEILGKDESLRRIQLAINLLDTLS
jgi:glutamyl-tRNA synthetase